MRRFDRIQDRAAFWFAKAAQPHAAQKAAGRVRLAPTRPAICSTISAGE
jgi:hypothetical protein